MFVASFVALAESYALVFQLLLFAKLCLIARLVLLPPGGSNADA